jgi:hypothetical protein
MFGGELGGRLHPSIAGGTVKSRKNNVLDLYHSKWCWKSVQDFWNFRYKNNYHPIFVNQMWPSLEYLFLEGGGIFRSDIDPE